MGHLLSESCSPKYPLMPSGVSDELDAYHFHTCSYSDSWPAMWNGGRAEIREREKDPVVPDTQMKRQPTDSFSLEAT